MSRSGHVRLSYDVFVPSEGEVIELPPVILLHGVTFSRKTWMAIPQVIADATKRKVYALDARNHGESEWTPEFDHDLMAKDVEKFMDYAHIAQAAFVGHSMGGKTAMILALSKPDKVEKLIVEDACPNHGPPRNALFPLEYLRLMKQSLSHIPEGADLETARKTVATYIENHTPEDQRSKNAPHSIHKTLPLKRTSKGAEWQVNIDDIEHAYLNNPETLSQRRFDGMYDGATLFIYGGKSVYEVEKGRRVILQLFPNAILSPIEDATHLVHQEFPEEFTAKVVQFIGKL